MQPWVVQVECRLNFFLVVDSERSYNLQNCRPFGRQGIERQKFEESVQVVFPLEKGNLPECEILVLYISRLTSWDIDCVIGRAVTGAPTTAGGDPWLCHLCFNDHSHRESLWLSENNFAFLFSMKHKLASWYIHQIYTHTLILFQLLCMLVGIKYKMYRTACTWCNSVKLPTVTCELTVLASS